MKVYGLDVEMVEVEPGNRRSAARVSIVAKNLQCIYDKYVRQESRVLCYNTEISGITKEMLRDGKLLKNVRADVLSILRNSIVVGHSIHYDLDVLNISDNDLSRINCIVRDTTTYSRFKRSRHAICSMLLLSWAFFHTAACLGSLCIRAADGNPKIMASKLAWESWTGLGGEVGHNMGKGVRRNGSTPSLKQLAKIFLHRDIQKGAHSSVVDARAALELYKRFEDDWEDEIDDEAESDSEDSNDDDYYSSGAEDCGIDFYYKGCFFNDV